MTLIIISSSCLTSCNKFVSLVTPIKKTNTYSVSTGGQSFAPFLYQNFSGLNHLSFIIKLNSDTIYKSPLAQEISNSSITQINKLIGFSDCGDLTSGPFHNSAYFGWAYYGGTMRIYPFLNGPEFKANGFSYGTFDNPLAIVSPNKEYRYAVDLINGAYQFSVVDLATNTVIGSRSVNRTQCSGSFHGVLFGPYFGGNIPAPQNMSMEITIE